MPQSYGGPDACQMLAMVVNELQNNWDVQLPHVESAYTRVVMASNDAGLSPVSFMIIPNTKRHPNNMKTDQLPISEVITGLPRPYHSKNHKNNYPGFQILLFRTEIRIKDLFSVDGKTKILIPGTM